jgi:hypothetical protein
VNDRRRVAAVIGCCVIAAVTPFIAGVITAVGGILLLGCAVLLIARSKWSLPTRLVASAVAVAATLALLTGFLILAVWDSD